LSMYVCLQDSPDTILLFSTLYMPKPSQPGLPYLVRDARYSEDATDVIISFLVSQGKAEFYSNEMRYINLRFTYLLTLVCQK